MAHLEGLIFPKRLKTFTGMEVYLKESFFNFKISAIGYHNVELSHKLTKGCYNVTSHCKALYARVTTVW